MTLNIEEIPTAVAGRHESTLDQIRARFQQAKTGQHLDMAIPGNPALGVRYFAADEDELGRLGDSDTAIGIDYLIVCCQTVLVRESHGWEPLTHDGQPVRFDQQLSEILDLGVPPAGQGGTARDVVWGVFSAAPSAKAAAGRHVSRLMTWLAGGSIDEEAMLGES